MVTTISHGFNINKEGSTLAGAEEIHVLELKLWLFDVHLLHHLFLDFLNGFDLDHVVAGKTPAFRSAF